MDSAGLNVFGSCCIANIANIAEVGSGSVRDVRDSTVARPEQAYRSIWLLLASRNTP
jgi:hypothetical protein